MVGCRVWVAEAVARGGGCCACLKEGEGCCVLGEGCCVLVGFGGGFLLECLGFGALRHRWGAGDEGEGLEGADQPGFDAHRPQQRAEELGADIAGSS